jgi:uncharacterized NAD(P)/FAD-binding protein YdhS
LFPVAIVGGGASGTILAVQLARRGIGSALIDGSGRMGRGVAYSTSEPAHLLNVRAEGMSALAGEPGHFAKHFADEGGHPRGFAQRRLFGRYLDELLREGVTSERIVAVEGTATGAVRNGDGWQVELDNGEIVKAAALVLATGNQEPEGLRAFAPAPSRFVGNPWGAAAQAAIGELAQTHADVLLVGTGLTMVDLVLSLDAAGHQGGIVAISRRGLIPRTHADNAPSRVDANDLPLGTLRGMGRWLRRRSAEVGWRAAVDSLRPHSHAIWQSLGEIEQRRFMRHARPWWDVHRHRIAPEVGETLARLIAEGRLRIMAGRIQSAVEAGDELQVEICARGADRPQRMSFGYAINCTGPLQAIRSTSDPLLRSLLDSGQVAADHLNLGLAVDDHARAGERLWALGPLTKGRYWEIVAVPDIREQAAAVAMDIERELAS